MSRSFLWFRNDLRLADHPAAVDALADSDEVLPVHIIDPRQIAPSPFGFSRMGPYRAQFLLESLADLDAQLHLRGSALRVYIGEPATVLSRIAAEWKVEAVYTKRQFAWEEQRHLRTVSEVLPVRAAGPPTLLHPEDLPLPIEKLPKVFTAFRHKVETHWQVRDALPEPSQLPTPTEWASQLPSLADLGCEAPTSDPRAVMHFTGGRAAALERLKHYFWDNRSLSSYKETRNGMIGADYSSKFSPWLALGCISAREVYHQVKRYERLHGANESTYWLVFELLWRDFFQFTAAKHGADLFKRSGIAHKPAQGNHDPRRFAAWCEGRTGQPFIDAHMRELAATGWMSNRGRQNTASYLVHDLGLDWRMGAWWFECMLIDYDPCSNWGNWQYIAGVGNDPRPLRKFLPDRQAAQYDPQGDHQRLWASSIKENRGEVGP
ncbi:MAG: DASH family cryptochrome [Flavobacteriales bacterium]|nr:DASH family cryptochrome [Flavobacteriales bacterium]